MKKLHQKQSDKSEMIIGNAVRRTKGIIKIDPKLGKKIAESDRLSSLES